MSMVSDREVLTPDQAADYLQVNRETIYRYIRDGRLAASKLGRAYRIPRRNLDRLLLATRTRDDIVLRDYRDEEVVDFLEQDRLTPEAEDMIRRFEAASGESDGALEPSAAAGRLVSTADKYDGLTDEELETLEREIDAWLDGRPEPLRLSEAVIADREGR